MISMRPRTEVAGSVIRAALATVLSVAVLPAGAAAQEPRSLELASDRWPPFTNKPELACVAVDLVQTALERAGVESSTSIVEWREVENGLRSGDWDGSAAMWRNDQRAELLLFSVPYLENRLVLVGRKGSDVSATELSDLTGKRVAAVGRYAYGDTVDNAVGVYFVNSTNDQDSLDKLLAGEVDYMLVDELVARYLMTYQPDEASSVLEIGSRTLARRTLHFVLRRDLPGAEEIMERFNSEIRAMLADGTYSEILQVAWIRADVDGDGLDELVALGDHVTPLLPGSVYDVFGEEPEALPEKQRIVVQGSIFEGWDAVPERYKGPTSPMDQSMKHGVTMMTLQF